MLIPVRCTNGEIVHIPLSAIHRVGGARANAHGVKMHRLETALDGEFERFSLFESEHEELMRRPIQLTPAEPGTRLCHVTASGTEPGIWKTPVTAWAICLDGQVRPVTPAGVNDGCGEPAEGFYVEMPDGTIEATSEWADTTHYPNAEALFAARVPK